MLTLKFPAAARGRDEYEYPVPLAEAEEMLAFASGASSRRHATMLGTADISTKWMFSGDRSRDW